MIDIYTEKKTQRIGFFKMICILTLIQRMKKCLKKKLI